MRIADLSDSELIDYIGELVEEEQSSVMNQIFALAEAERRKLYAEFLIALRERDTLWKALPREIADWWRVRDAGEDAGGRLAYGRMEAGERIEETVLLPPGIR